MFGFVINKLKKQKMVKFVSAYGSGFVYSTFCVPLYV